MVDSDHTWPECQAGFEQFCPNVTLTYNTPDKHLGGGTAPLLCAGIITYSPMRHWHVSKGKKVGVVGLGGLGHMGVKFARAFGAHTVVFTTSPGKKEDALRL